MSASVSDQLVEWLKDIGISPSDEIYYRTATEALIEQALARGEGHLSAGGAFVTRTGSYTGRAAKDKYILRDDATDRTVDWSANTALTAEQWKGLRAKIVAHASDNPLFVEDVFCGADPAHRLSVRIVTMEARHSAFVRNMFRMPTEAELAEFEPNFTVIQCPNLLAVPEEDGTRSGAFVALNFSERTVIIGGTQYAGEVKKSVFSAMNYYAPDDEVLSMHCSANVGADSDVALFFGLSGTGKTTLSADPSRRLIGDDEHGWGSRGVFNLEGGCYAKVIKLNQQAEPEIYATTSMFGTILENVVMDYQTRRLDLDDGSITENTRASYPLTAIPNFVPAGMGAHPRNIVFLTCDAFGVLPPISRLTPEQAMYHFLSGYTAKVAGTEVGVTEPEATFSACFGAPFMPRHPTVYAELLGQKMASTGAAAWLVNTGWSGGPYGVGTRISIKHTRALLNAALEGQLRDVPTRVDPNFGVAVPTAVPGVPTEVLDPRSAWADASAYDTQAARLAGLFRENFERFASRVGPQVIEAGPR